MRVEFEESLVQLQRLGYQLAATPGTATFYAQRGHTGIVTLSKPTDEARQFNNSNSNSSNSGGSSPVLAPAAAAECAVAAAVLAAVVTAVAKPSVLLADSLSADLLIGGSSGGAFSTSSSMSSSSSSSSSRAVLEWIRNKRIDLVINIPEGSTRTDEVTSGYLMRRTAVDFGCSLLTNIK